MKSGDLRLISENIRPTINVVQGRPTPPEERDKAYMVWAWACNRDIKRTAEAIAVDRNTVASWARQDEWALRWEQEVADTSPQSQRMLAFFHLGNNTYRAARVLSELLGATPEEYADQIMEHIDAAGWDTVDRDQLRAALRDVLAANHHIQKVRIAAAQDILNRCGISADAGMRMVTAARQAANETPVQDLTDEELFDQI